MRGTPAGSRLLTFVPMPPPPATTSSFADPWQLVTALAACNGDARYFESDALGSIPVRLADSERGWESERPLPDDVRQMLDLYVPLLGPVNRPYVVAHLGQSIDGFIAGGDGESALLNGAQNIVHLHRLRALFQVVLVGCNTACADDPRLTTRLVEGPNPTRVVVDPYLRCGTELNIFHDHAAPTLLACASDAPWKTYPAHVEVLRTSVGAADFGLREVLSLLRQRGLDRIFIEGGGHTVSAALSERLLDRLHVAVAPLFIGAGIPGLRLPELRHFADAMRPPCKRFDMGSDVLFDFALR